MRKIVASVALQAILAAAPPAFAQNHPATFRDIASDPTAAEAFEVMAKGHRLPDCIHGKTVESPGHEVMYRRIQGPCHERLQAA